LIGSVSEEAAELARREGLAVIPGSSPRMFLDPADFPHRCMRWVLGATCKMPEPEAYAPECAAEDPPPGCARITFRLRYAEAKHHTPLRPLEEMLRLQLCATPSNEDATHMNTQTARPLAVAAEKVFIEINCARQGMFITRSGRPLPVLLYLHGSSTLADDTLAGRAVGIGDTD
jgi:hypothetical protein